MDIPFGRAAVAEIEEILKWHRPPPLRIGQHTARLPIVQGGMAVGISLSGLASAVANAGGIGVIAAPGVGLFEPDFFQNFFQANIRGLRREIQKARSKTRGILGVNIMVALTDFTDLARAAIEEGIDIIFAGAGLPLKLPELLGENRHTKLVPIVSSARAARILCKKWQDDFNYTPDAFVVEGPMAGGHLGFKAEELDSSENRLENLVPEVIAAVQPFAQAAGRPIPVIAGGGIFTGEDIYNMLQTGAAGVQMATRFVATDECDASPAFKQAYIESKEGDAVIIKSPVGMPGRALRNEFIDSVNAGAKKPFKCPQHCVKTCNYLESPYCIFVALLNAQRGHLSGGFAFCGANVHRVNEIVPVKKLVDTLVKEYKTRAVQALIDAMTRYMNGLMASPALGRGLA
ncbi:NAD(P)H-dependent flavin oxidoreductase [Dehalogenimonas alkenigignens]|uniref:NAD(P)H-dependent flavin oxidoreductase n=1 Tax=Dehalogenimonas alkenigignens TaxID=1217799 RepID=UPI000D5735D9|nr:nitronate monooxygenase [Dehalogenimonas alkenigignens]PVV85172.1 nitronate monooxygenase [Dehalogenimonas alkenigignens]